MFGIIVEMCNSVKIVVVFLVYLHLHCNSDIHYTRFTENILGRMGIF